MEQLGCMLFEHDDGPSGEKLILVKIDIRQSKVGDEMVFSRPAALAGFTYWICHVPSAEHSRAEIEVSIEGQRTGSP